MQMASTTIASVGGIDVIVSTTKWRPKFTFDSIFSAVVHFSSFCRRINRVRVCALQLSISHSARRKRNRKTFRVYRCFVFYLYANAPLLIPIKCTNSLAVLSDVRWVCFDAHYKTHRAQIRMRAPNRLFLDARKSRKNDKNEMNANAPCHRECAQLHDSTEPRGKNAIHRMLSFS